MIKTCAWFNIVVGSIATLGGLNLFFLGYGLAGSSFRSFIWALIFFGPLFLAGLLYFSSGVILMRSLPSVSGKALIYQGLAVILGIGYCLGWMTVGRLDPYNEVVLLFVFIPAAGLLMAIIEFGYLWKKWQCKDHLT